MFQVIILTCALSVSHADCRPETALSVTRGPHVQNEIGCNLGGFAGFGGQPLLASLSAGLVDAETYPKITCRRVALK